MKIYSIIPARGGSKSVPMKNIRCLNGFPLIAYAICASKLSKSIERTIVSTDSPEIAETAKIYGAEVPFVRPGEISQDSSTDLELFRHAMTYFKEQEGIVPDLLVQLRPTTPLRVPSEVDRAVICMNENRSATSLRSAHELPESPFKMFKIDEEGFFRGFFPDEPRQEYYNLPRQMFPIAYKPNGYVDIVKPDVIRKSGTLHGPNILAFITPYAPEVDKPSDFEYLKYGLQKFGNPVYKYLIERFSKERQAVER